MTVARFVQQQGLRVRTEHSSVHHSMVDHRQRGTSGSNRNTELLMFTRCVRPCLLSLLLPCLVPALCGVLSLLPAFLQHSAQAAQGAMGKQQASLGEWQSPISSELIVSKVSICSCSQHAHKLPYQYILSYGHGMLCAAHAAVMQRTSSRAAAGTVQGCCLVQCAMRHLLACIAAELQVLRIGSPSVLANGDITWVEMRPSEQGRSVLTHRQVAEHESACHRTCYK